MSRSKVLGSEWKYSEEELHEAFKSVSDSNDWRAPIEKWILKEKMTVVEEAISFYTATETKIIDRTSTHYKIYSIGYHNSPCGDH